MNHVFEKQPKSMHPRFKNTILYASGSGFTLIELMIVVAIISIILTLALPAYNTYTTRAKIGEAISVAAAAKTTVTATCMENPTLTGLDNDAVGYAFGRSVWVQSITITENCLQPVINIFTQNTGALAPPPQITLTGSLDADGGAFTWNCASPNAPDHFLPSTCRS